MGSGNSNNSLISKESLTRDYSLLGLSSKDIAKKNRCSENKINYWLKKFKIKKRSISEAIYLKRNPDGDPFLFKRPKSSRDFFTLGLGIGLFWGEGTKRSKGSVRLGNTDPILMKEFIRFLIEVFNIEKKDLRFGLQIFDDHDESELKNYWATQLNISEGQFYKTMMKKKTGTGTYKHRCQYGVLTLYYNNKKMKDLLCNMIEKVDTLY